HGLERVVTVDIGGTSSDMAVCTPSRPDVTTQTWLGALPLITPTVNVTAIGAGGGSLVRVDSHGLLKVGPESAGADPGPVCYGRGGAQPTITDCYLTLGLLRSDGFAGGRMLLDRDAARVALDKIGAQLGFGSTDRAVKAAAAALSVATSNMATEMLKDLARRGVDPNEVVLLPFGGAGPTHAAMLAEEVRIQRITVPPAPGLFCAFGALAADARRDFIRMVKRPLDDRSALMAKDHFATLTQEAQQWLAEEGPLIGSRTFLLSADMSYVGQAYEINVDLPVEPDITVAALGASFHEAHHRLYGFADPEAPIELQNVRVQAVGAMTRPRPAQWQPREGVASTTRRNVWQADDWLEFQVAQRDVLTVGATLKGPTLVEQPDTTVFIPSGWTAHVLGDGTLMMEKKQ
ncbi:MAG: hydantoinase/oxoprolinase family protein, partial [Polycyclovorans sp.]|nr:hydantoinase/oxoprolinase family protein [Polycyclovorans sp.]